MEFTEFPKIARLSRDCVITEKIDGTNASILFYEVADCSQQSCDGLHVMVGSRTKWLGPGKEDNFGFYAWVMQNLPELKKLGPGHHFGEWWGGKIQRGYGLKEKRFSLFNTSLWTEENKPACCHIVPVLYQGLFTTDAVEAAIFALRTGGSLAAPGYMNPEGVVVFHTAANMMFKKTLLKDESPKSLVAEIATA